MFSLLNANLTPIAQLKQVLAHYRQLPYHDDNALANKLSEVQDFQRLRVFKSHQALFAEPKNQAMAEYFVNRLYGGEQFEQMARQLDIILPKAERFEKLVPSGALETGTLAIAAAVEAIELDTQLAQYLQEQDLPVNYDNMLTAYRAVDAKAARIAQIEHMKDVCYRTDKYINSFILQKAFALAKNKAYSYGLQPLYDFIAAGFAAMKPLKKVANFIEPFAERELSIVTHVHSSDNNGKIDPFDA